MAKFGLLLIVCLSLLAFGQSVKRYDGDKVIRVTPRTARDVEILAELQRKHKYDFWNPVKLIGHATDIQVDKGQLNNLLTALDNEGLEYSIYIDDVQRLIEENEAARKMFRKENRFYTYYPSFTEMEQRLAQRSIDCGSRCSLFSIGLSFEGRNLWVLRISGNTFGGGKRRVWIDSGIHAREWISHTTNFYFIDRLIDDYGSDEVTTRLLDTYDFYHLVNMNPDGYEYAYTEERLWRTTRSVFPEFADENPENCIGCDANRNFDFEWMTIGASDDPCELTFAGYFPESEPEVQAVRDYILDRSDQIDFFITMHSYSQLFLLPYGYTSEAPYNYDDMYAAAEVAANALGSVYGTVYTYDSASVILYTSSGTSRDWAHGKALIPYVYTIELRDEGQYGFVLPPEQIEPTAIETWAGVSAMIDFVITQQEEK